MINAIINQIIACPFGIFVLLLLFGPGLFSETRIGRRFLDILLGKGREGKDHPEIYRDATGYPAWFKRFDVEYYRFFRHNGRRASILFAMVVVLGILSLIYFSGQMAGAIIAFLTAVFIAIMWGEISREQEYE